MMRRWNELSTSEKGTIDLLVNSIASAGADREFIAPILERAIIEVGEATLAEMRKNP
jgi:hypothetical protein